MPENVALDLDCDGTAHIPVGCISAIRQDKLSHKSRHPSTATLKDIRSGYLRVVFLTFSALRLNNPREGMSGISCFALIDCWAEKVVTASLEREYVALSQGWGVPATTASNAAKACVMSRSQMQRFSLS